ncbi:MAG: methyltransferase domain-containing protein [Acidobacteriota bacterium]|nr:methyltransferase domain-containing protein [Acidobacteriota bacterium]
MSSQRERSRQNDFKQRDAASYDNVVLEFDRFTSRLTAPLADRMIRASDLKDGERVLDIGTGTGIVALRASEAVGASGEVVGIDLSSQMLAQARTRAHEQDLALRTKFVNMDAENLLFPDKSFDVVFALFSLLHLPDPSRALSEMYRVLRTGGRLVIAVGSPPPILSISGTLNRLSRLLELPSRIQGSLLLAPEFLNNLVTELIPGDSVEETQLASAHRNRSGTVPCLVSHAGFKNLHSFWEGYCACLTTAEEFWDLQRTYSSIARKRLESASPAVADTVRSTFMRQCATVLAKGGRMLYHYAAFYVVARRA